MKKDLINVSVRFEPQELEPVKASKPEDIDLAPWVKQLALERLGMRPKVPSWEEIFVKLATLPRDVVITEEMAREVYRTEVLK